MTREQMIDAAVRPCNGLLPLALHSGPAQNYVIGHVFGWWRALQPRAPKRPVHQEGEGVSETPVVIDLDAAISAAERAGKCEAALFMVAQALRRSPHAGLFENLRQDVFAALEAAGMEHLAR